MDSQKILLKVEEAAKLLSCSRSFIYKILATGQLRSVKLGADLRIPRSEVERLASIK